MFWRAKAIIWVINSFLLMSIDAAFLSINFNVSEEIRIEMTSFAGFLGENFSKSITTPLALLYSFCYN